MTGAPASARRRRIVRALIGFFGVVVIGVVAFAVWPRASAVVAGPRFLTTGEAQVMAMSRFNNFNDGTREVTLKISAPGGTVDGTGYFDYESGAGAALFTSGEAGAPTTLIWWNYDVLGERPVDASTSLREEIPGLAKSQGWRFEDRDAAVGTPIGAALTITAGYRLDRPDNPQLLEQSDATWLGAVGGSSPGRFWVQLPSADAVRADGSRPVETTAIPRLQIDHDGTAWKIERGGGQAGGWTVQYGNTSDLGVPAIPAALSNPGGGLTTEDAGGASPGNGG